MNERNIQHSPSNQLGVEEKKKSGSKGKTLNQRQFGAKGSSKGFGHVGAQSFGGRGMK